MKTTLTLKILAYQRDLRFANRVKLCQGGDWSGEEKIISKRGRRVTSVTPVGVGETLLGLGNVDYRLTEGWYRI